jgi:hypothetical protein
MALSSASRLTRLVLDGVNQLTVTVFTKLGPMLDDTSPTAGVYADRRISGLLGPVRLLTWVPRLLQAV